MLVWVPGLAGPSDQEAYTGYLDRSIIRHAGKLHSLPVNPTPGVYPDGVDHIPLERLAQYRLPEDNLLLH